MTQSRCSRFFLLDGMIGRSEWEFSGIEFELGSTCAFPLSNGNELLLKAHFIGSLHQRVDMEIRLFTETHLRFTKNNLDR